MVPAAGVRDCAAAVAGQHRGGAAREVADAVGQIRVVAGDERFVGEIAVLAEDDLPQQVVAQPVHADDLLDGQGADDVALGLGHLVAVENEPAMRPDLLGQGQAGCHEEGGPVHGMEAEDLLADEMHVDRPQALVVAPLPLRLAEAYRAHVGRQRVEPHVEDMFRIVRERDAPTQARSADREIPESAAHEREDLVAARFGLHEIRLGLVQVDQPLLVFRQAEEVVFFRQRRDQGRVGRRGLLVGDERLVAEMVLAFVGGLVDRAVRLAAFENLTHRQGVPRIARAAEEVIVQAQLVPFAAERGGNAVGELLGLEAGGLGRLGDLLAVLVRTRGQVSLVAEHPPDPLDRVRHDRGVGVPDVRGGVDVVDRRREIERGHWRTHFLVSHGARRVPARRAQESWPRRNSWFACCQTCRKGTPRSRASRRQSSYSGAKFGAPSAGPAVLTRTSP